MIDPKRSKKFTQNIGLNRICIWPNIWYFVTKVKNQTLTLKVNKQTALEGKPEMLKY